MDDNARVGAVTSSTGNIQPDGEILGRRWLQDQRLRRAITAARPELFEEQLAAIRRMLRLEAVVR